MKISLISIGSRQSRTKREREDSLVEEYIARTARFTSAEGVWVETESAFWSVVDNASRRTPARVILMDSAGRLFSSVEFAEIVGEFRDRGTQRLVVGIGGADGWKAEARRRADLLVSIGRLTLPHSLARVVAAEQIYRAMTILARYPYHCDH